METRSISFLSNFHRKDSSFSLESKSVRTAKWVCENFVTNNNEILSKHDEEKRIRELESMFNEDLIELVEGKSRSDQFIHQFLRNRVSGEGEEFWKLSDEDHRYKIAWYNDEFPEPIGYYVWTLARDRYTNWKIIPTLEQLYVIPEF